MREPVVAAKKITGGFSLIELIFVLTIAGILLLFAYPSYQQYVARVQRAEAIRQMMSVANCLEETRARAGLYDIVSCSRTAVNGDYRLRVTPPGLTAAAEYRIIAEPIRPRGNDVCGNLSLDQSGTRGISGNQEALAACWGGR
jgi:type IV pilus assembly protein PilE